MEDAKEVETIGMLLDIEHLYGEHEGRLGPVVLTLSICAAPILMYIYLALWSDTSMVRDTSGDNHLH